VGWGSAPFLAEWVDPGASRRTVSSEFESASGVCLSAGAVQPAHVHEVGRCRGEGGRGRAGSAVQPRVCVTVAHSSVGPVASTVPLRLRV
jgi:hypothetical protein